jgi:hypothetical protein
MARLVHAIKGTTPDPYSAPKKKISNTFKGARGNHGVNLSSQSWYVFHMNCPARAIYINTTATFTDNNCLLQKGDFRPRAVGKLS